MHVLDIQESTNMKQSPYQQCILSPKAPKKKCNMETTAGVAEACGKIFAVGLQYRKHPSFEAQLRKISSYKK